MHVDGYEAGRVKYSIRGPGAVVSEKEMMGKAAKESIEGVELRIATRTEVWEGADWGSDKDWT